MKIVTAVALTALLFTGCASKNDTQEAVKQGIVRDLAKKFDMSKMDILVDSVSFRDKEADATVTFVLKGGSASQGMSMQYVMERHDDNQWYIKSRASAAMAGADGATGSMPAGHPAMDGGGESSAGGSAPDLPAGHPDTGHAQ